VTRILLVEGDDRDAQALDRTLRTHDDWEVVRTGTLLEAIRHAGESKFDAAVLDTDLPDGSGLDILDFLRIGSPGIRIVLLSDTASESVAFHALSHGAGDFIVKDTHLEQELPRRIGALLDHPQPMGALVETLSHVRAYDAPGFGPPLVEVRREGPLDAALGEIVGQSITGAGVWDLRGKCVATKTPADLDADGVGFAMATLHSQVGALWTYGNVKPTGYRLIIDIEGGLLGVTAIPGTFIVAVLFEAGFSPRRALERLDEAGMRVLAALQGGASGNDLV
jgi:CheY-like chemotaxis protein